MASKESINFAKRALKIMDIKYEETFDLQYYIDKLINAILFPATTTEGEILLISREIAIEIQKPLVDAKKVEKMLEDLDFKVSYWLFD